MSKKLADFFHQLATDANTLKKFNQGTGAELEKNREALMQAHGLSDEDKKKVHAHDNDAVHVALQNELGMSLGSWSNSTNSNIKVVKISGNSTS